MTQDKAGTGSDHGHEKAQQGTAGQEGNPFGGSPTFPDPSSVRPTGDTTGFNGSYTETEHHTQHEYDAGNQQSDPGPEAGPDAGTESGTGSAAGPGGED